MDRQILLAHARDALEKLYQESLLQIHPLAGLLLPEVPVAGRGAALKQMLLQVMQQLRPSHTTAYDSPAWRRYRSLFQLYLEGKSFEEIAREQGISDRQARRDQHQAIEELGDFLWARYCQIDPGAARLVAPEELAADRSSGDDDASLEVELRRIGAVPPGEPIDVGDTLRGVMAVVQKLADRLGLRIDVAVADALPTVVANQTALRQALLSALSCVLESTPGASVGVSVAAVADGVDLCIRAPGWRTTSSLDPDASARLALSQRLLELQGGRLELHLDDGQSACVRLTLPSSQAPTVLIVDDNPDVLRLFQRYLQSTSCRLIQATTAEQALQLVREVPPRLITLDLMMPLRDGWDLLQVLRRGRATQDTPIVVCSVVHERTLALTMGATYFLPKPVSRASLLEVLEQCGLGTLDRLQARADAAHQLAHGEAALLRDPEELGGHRLVGESLPGHQDDRDVPQRRQLPHPSQQLIPTQVGHDQVE